MSDQGGGGGEGGALRSLTTHLGFSLDAHNAHVAESLFEKLINNAHHLLEALALLEVGKELYHFAHAAAEAGTAALLAGEKFGITADDVQSLGFAAGQAGVSFEQVGHGLKLLQKNAYEASQGNKGAAKTFHDLGLKVTDSSGKVKPAIELFQEFADKIKDTQDPAKRTALSVLALGRSGSELLPLLREGGEGIREMMERAHLLGAVMDEETVEAAHRLHRSMLELNAGITGVKNRIGASLFPALQKATDGLVNWLMANRKLIDSGIQVLGDAVTWLGDKVGKLADLMDHHRSYVVALTAAFAALALAQFASLVPLVAMTLGYLAFAAVIAATWEEVYHFADGTNSLLGDLYAKLKETEGDVNSIWLVRALAWVAKQAFDAVKWVGKLIEYGQFFEKFFGGTRAKILGYAVDGLIPGASAAGLGGKIRGAFEPDLPKGYQPKWENGVDVNRFSFAPGIDDQAPHERVPSRGQREFNAKQLDKERQELANFFFEASLQTKYGPGSDPYSEPVSGLGPTNAPSRISGQDLLGLSNNTDPINIAGSTIDIHIDGAKSPEQTGDAVMRALEDEQERQRAAIDNATRNRINR